MTNTITQLKEQAEKKFAELDLPTFNHGKGFALNLTVDWEKVFAEIQRAEDAEIIADEKVKVCKLSELGEEFISKYAQKLVSAENKLLALHYATNPEATVIIIPRDTKIEHPITINLKTSKAASAESIIVVAEEGAEATIIEKNISEQDTHYQSRILQIYVEPRAKISYSTLHGNHANTHSFICKRAEVLQDAKIECFDFILGEGITQVQLRSHLKEAGAEAQQYQAIVGTEAQQCDINSDAFHEHSNTTSVMLAKGILSEKSRAMHRGTIRVEKNAANCHGHQRSDMLLIGEEARCNAIPVLEVENDDVSCSHGTTMGQIDEEQLYYLVSRGLDEDLAKQMLVTAFFEPILRKISNEKTREEILNTIQEKLGK
ncbi:MAG: Fe-S cluster assembly protein SufD [Nanoarchaeota archaeon]|nr:Fe-S cluster assembly protein SufD [Nanoarchaeota archaeon]